jgi:hypothetical protein
MTKRRKKYRYPTKAKIIDNKIARVSTGPAVTMWEGIKKWFKTKSLRNNKPESGKMANRKKK